MDITIRYLKYQKVEHNVVNIFYIILNLYVEFEVSDISGTILKNLVNISRF